MTYLDLVYIILISNIFDLRQNMNVYYLDNAKVFKAFCDEQRLKILELLQSGEKCACVLLEKLNIGQSTLSHHMKIMVQSGIVASRNVGKWTYYTISPQGTQAARDLLAELTAVNGKNKDSCSCAQTKDCEV